MQRLAAAVPDVRRVEIGPIEATGKRLVDWTIWLKGFELQWQEEQLVDVQNMRIVFHQTNGFFATYNGAWQIAPFGNETQMDLEINVDSGLPHLSKFVNPVLCDAFKAFARQVVDALTKRGFTT